MLPISRHDQSIKLEGDEKGLDDTSIPKPCHRIFAESLKELSDLNNAGESYINQAMQTIHWWGCYTIIVRMTFSTEVAIRWGSKGKRCYTHSKDKNPLWPKLQFPQNNAIKLDFCFNTILCLSCQSVNSSVSYPQRVDYTRFHTSCHTFGWFWACVQPSRRYCVERSIRGQFR